MKLKFAGFLRGLLRHMDDRAPARHVNTAMPSPATSSALATPAPARQNNLIPPAIERAPANATEIQIPLAAVIAHLPMDLKAKLISAPAAKQPITLAVETVLQQLAFGSVKISFGELRSLAPGLFADSGGAFDSRQISLPLPEILSRLNPALLARKPSQKVDVAEDIAGPFDGRGRGISFTTQPLKPATPSSVVAEVQPMNQPVPFTSPAAIPPRTVTPAQATDTEGFAFKPRQTAPPFAAIPFNPPPIVSNGNGNANVNSHSNGNGNGHANLPPFKFTTAPAPSAPVNSSSPRPEPAQPTLLVSLDDLAENWPAELKAEIVGFNFASASAALPMNFIEAGLKRGRVTMLWKDLRTLAKPSSPASPHDALEIELSLKTLAPMFFAAQKKPTAPKKLVVAEEIPNLFFGFPTGNPETMASPAAASAAQKPVDTNFYVWGDTADVPVADEQTFQRNKPPQTDFLSRQTHPQEIVARALVLPGVAGAVVTLADGLRVASQVPETLNADAVAAFLPQIYERVHQTTRELRMGALNNVSFTVGSVSWKIFRVNSVYFAAFGRAGEALPKTQLAALAAELERKQKI